jgi:hypothetical protein
MHKLLRILDQIGELEQGGGPAQHWREKALPLPPVIIWRHKSRSAELAAWFARVIAEYRGTTVWRFDSSGTNWGIGPQRLWDFAAERGLAGPKDAETALGEQDPSFSREANEDIERLADFIWQRWCDDHPTG